MISTVATTIPDYLNTISILSYCLDIANIILPLLQDGNPAIASTKSFIDMMTTVRNDVGDALNIFVPFIQTLADVIAKIIAFAKSFPSTIQDTIEKVKNGFQSFESVLSPIKDATDAIESALAPVKWALDAASCIFDTVFKPVIDAVLDATGLSSLFDGLLDKLEGALHLDDVFSLGNLFKGVDVNDWAAAAGSNAVQTKGVSSWSSVAVQLAQYDSRDKGKTYTLITTLVADISGSPVGSGTPRLPDWPQVPKINTASTQVSNESKPAHAYSIAAIAPQPGTIYLRNKRAILISNCTNLLLTISTAAPHSAMKLGEVNPSPSSSVIWVTDVLAKAKLIQPNYDGLPAVSDLVAFAKVVKQDLAKAEALGASLVNSLQVFDGSRQLPAALKEEVNDFAVLFQDGERLMEFLLNFGWAQGIFQDLQQAFKDQVADASLLNSTADQLVTTATSIDNVILQVIAMQPTQQQFVDGLAFIDKIVSSSVTIANVFQGVFKLKSSPDALTRLTAMRDSVNTEAISVKQQLTDIHNTVMNALATAQSIISFLSQFADQFVSISGNIAKITQVGLPKLTQVVRVSNVVASILDPLEGIMNDMNCVDSSNPIKQGGNAELTTLKSIMKGIITQQSPLIVSSLDFVTQQLVPTKTIATQMQSTIGLFTADLPQLQSDCQNICAAFNDLKTKMVPPKSYTIQVPPIDPTTGKPQAGAQPVPQTIDNFFTDDGVLAEAQQIAKLFPQAQA